MKIRTWLLDEKSGNKLYEQERKTKLSFEKVEEKFKKFGYREFGASYEGIDLLLYKPTEWAKTGFAAIIKEQGD